MPRELLERVRRRLRETSVQPVGDWSEMYAVRRLVDELLAGPDAP